MSISSLHSSLRRTVVALTLATAVACSATKPAPSSELERDLEAAKLSELEMAGARGQRTNVTSAIEQIPTSPKQPKVAATTPDKSAQDAAPCPSDPPKATPKGEYKSTSDVIRNAPFPIKPFGCVKPAEGI